ncbi:TadA family conjugal transfer-associated ATPase [Actinomyces vulturis]|uniref:TadA family conjugal transfer-associated ATPase n=1 Tax=Actinomyces vulturis TaxID=1857645 RepID=UPI0008378377|nr:TadA family conjugal transfer-associated ATPase [Actinomyces vulturis]
MINQHQLRRMRQALAQGHELSSVLTAQSDVFGMSALDTLHETLQSDIAGAGTILNPLLHDPSVTDVLINGTEIWVDRGSGLHRHSVDLSTDPRALAVRLTALCGKRLDDASPIADGILPQGTRMHAVLETLSSNGPLICLRTSRPQTWSLAALNTCGTIPDALLPMIRGLVQGRANGLLSGATGSGKTTMLGALLAEVPVTERIMCIEEIPELKPNHPHVVHLHERDANIQFQGAISMSDLVRAAMRMRPDRIILGECRGSEIRDVLAAMNTGHDGGWATIHANSAYDVPARLQALGALSGLSDHALTAQASSAIDVVVHMDKVRTHEGQQQREISSIGLLVRHHQELAVIPACTVHWSQGSSDVLPQEGWDDLCGLAEVNDEQRFDAVCFDAPYGQATS